jgi:hypothetical protein
MQLGKTLVGAIIGALLGVALLYGVHLAFRLDQFWLAIPVAILTGLGVRMAVATTGHASYVRGALTAVLALAAYIGGMYVVAAVARTQSDAAMKAKPAPAAAGESAEDGQGKQEGAEPAAEVPLLAPPAGAIADERRPRPAIPQQFSLWDALSLAVAAFIAYELGRGSGVPRETMATPSEQTPAGTHPDA